jgi:dTDP-4-dehydrorhamnose reductase
LVFDGRREWGGYGEDDAAAPITDYGRAKLAGERAVADAAPDALIVRTSLIYGGDRPSPHELMVLDALDGRRDVAFFSDELRCPILAGELAGALLELARRPLSGTLHVAGADTVSRLEFARLVALANGRDPDSLNSALSAGVRPRRPLNCALDCSRAAGVLAAPPQGVRTVLGAGVPAAGQSLH